MTVLLCTGQLAECVRGRGGGRDGPDDRGRLDGGRSGLGSDAAQVRDAPARGAGRGAAQARARALVLKDRVASGFDYLVVTGEGGHRLHPVTVVARTWSLSTGRSESGSMSTPSGRCVSARGHRRGRCRCGTRSMSPGEQVTLHSFPAVTSREHAGARGRVSHSRGVRCEGTSGRDHVVCETLGINRSGRWRSGMRSTT